MLKQSIIFLLFSTLIFSVTETEKINLSEQFSKLNPQEKRIVQKSYGKLCPRHHRMQYESYCMIEMNLVIMVGYSKKGTN